MNLDPCMIFALDDVNNYATPLDSLHVLFYNILLLLKLSIETHWEWEHKYLFICLFVYCTIALLSSCLWYEGLYL